MKKVRLGSEAPWPLLSPTTFSPTRWGSLSLQCPSLLCSLRSTRAPHQPLGAACWKETPCSISPQGRYTQGESGEDNILLVPVCPCGILWSPTPVPQSSSVPTGVQRLTMEELPFICRTDCYLRWLHLMQTSQPLQPKERTLRSQKSKLSSPCQRNNLEIPWGWKKKQEGGCRRGANKRARPQTANSSESEADPSRCCAKASPFVRKPCDARKRSARLH